MHLCVNSGKRYRVLSSIEAILPVKLTSKPVGDQLVSSYRLACGITHLDKRLYSIVHMTLSIQIFALTSLLI